MARFRISPPARTDLARILAASAERWGTEGRRRYASVLAAAMRQVAADPQGPTTRDRAELAPGVRSLHARHVRGLAPEPRVKRPVHIVYYRSAGSDVIEIVRVLHERMEPRRHFGGEPEDDG
jgi:toxin ParE1/3/4